MFFVRKEQPRFPQIGPDDKPVQVIDGPDETAALDAGVVDVFLYKAKAELTHLINEVGD